MNGVNWTKPSIAGRPGVAGRRCLGVAKDDLLKAGVRELEAALLGENRPGSEKRTRFERLVDGVFACSVMPGPVLALTGELSTLLRRFCRLKAIGISKSAAELDAIMRYRNGLPSFTRLRAIFKDGLTWFPIQMLCQTNERSNMTTLIQQVENRDTKQELDLFDQSCIVDYTVYIHESGKIGSTSHYNFSGTRPLFGRARPCPTSIGCPFFLFSKLRIEH